MSGRVSAAVALRTARCAIQSVNIIRGTVLHLDIFGTLVIVKTNLTDYFPVCHCGMNTFQPAWKGCTTFVFGHEFGWHSCSCVPLEAIPTFCKTTVTQNIFLGIRIFSIRAVQDFVISTRMID